eukprot:7378954-Prymnesium_polylepis.1
MGLEGSKPRSASSVRSIVRPHVAACAGCGLPARQPGSLQPRMPLRALRAPPRLLAAAAADRRACCARPGPVLLSKPCEVAVRPQAQAKKRCREEQRLVLELPGHPEHCVVPHVVQDALTATKSDAVCRTVGDAVCDCANAFGIAAWAQAWHGWRKQSGAGGE